MSDLVNSAWEAGYDAAMQISKKRIAELEDQLRLCNIGQLDAEAEVERLKEKISEKECTIRDLASKTGVIVLKEKLR